GEEMVSGSGCPRDLPVEKLAVAFHLVYQLGEQSANLLFGVRQVEPYHGGTVKHAVQMVLESKNFMVIYHGGLIDAVPEVKAAVVCRYHHLINGCDASVVIGE